MRASWRSCARFHESRYWADSIPRNACHPPPFAPARARETQGRNERRVLRGWKFRVASRIGILPNPQQHTSHRAGALMRAVDGARCHHPRRTGVSCETPVRTGRFGRIALGSVAHRVNRAVEGSPGWRKPIEFGNFARGVAARRKPLPHNAWSQEETLRETSRRTSATRADSFRIRWVFAIRGATWLHGDRQTEQRDP